MNVLRGYIVGAILRSVGTAMLTLATVFTIIDLVGQVDDVGTADYGFREAAIYVLLGIPRTVVEALPAATLIGTLLGLGQLASQSELLAMRAAGLSKLQLLSTVAIAGLLLAGAMAVLGESFAPSLGAYARDLRARSMLEESTLASGESSWLKDGDVILNFHRSFGARSFDRSVRVYELGARRALDAVAHAESIEVDGSDQWALVDYAETRFSADGASVEHLPRLVRHYGVAAELLDLSIVREDLLDTPALERYIGYLRNNGLDANRYLIAYWRRWSEMVSVPLMALLALPFAFGGLRSAGNGARFVVGLVIGLGLFVVENILSNSGAAFGFDPAIVAWAPTAVLAAISLLAVARYG